MAKNKTAVTNAMRILKAAKIDFKEVEYEADEVGTSFGEKIAELTGISPDISLKTLVARGDKTGIMVACIPVKSEIDLKKLARASGNKKVEMIHVKELLDLTGYIRGGVSPIGMKKPFPTFIDSSSLEHDHIYISAGVRGLQIGIAPRELIEFVGATVAELTA